MDPITLAAARAARSFSRVPKALHPAVQARARAQADAIAEAARRGIIPKPPEGVVMCGPFAFPVHEMRSILAAHESALRPVA